jgi:MATE family multidrug resistance protein
MNINDKSQFRKLFSKDNLTLSEKVKELSDTILPILNTSIPTSFFFLCLFLQQAMNISFISKTYNNYKMVDAIGLSHLYINCSTFIVTAGLTNGLDALGSNAFSRGNNYILGLYINRARIVSYGFLIIMTIFNYFFGMQVLSYFSIDPEILEHCSHYLYKNLFMLYIEVTFNINIRILSITGKSMTNMKTLVVTVLLHPLWCYLFIVKLDLGVSGAAYALILSQFLNAASSSCYIFYYDPAPGSNFFPSAECFKGVWEYLKVALPVAGIAVSEWMGFEIQSLIAIKVGELEYSVHIILVSINVILFTYSIGLNIAIATKISALIVEVTDSAEELIETCIRKANIFICFGTASMGILMLVVYLFRDFIVSLYTNDHEIHTMTRDCIGIVGLFCLGDMNKFVFLGIFRGLTFLNTPAILQFIIIYFIQTLGSYMFGLSFKMGISGIWISLTLSVWILDICYAYYYYNFDFQKYRNLSIDRLNIEKQELEECFEKDTLSMKSKDSRSVSMVSNSYNRF